MGKQTPKLTGFIIRVELRTAQGELRSAQTFDIARPAELFFFRMKALGVGEKPEVPGSHACAVCIVNGRERVFTDDKTTTPRRFYRALDSAVRAATGT